MPGGFDKQEFHLGVHAPQFIGRPLLHHAVEFSIQAQEKPFLVSAQ